MGQDPCQVLLIEDESETIALIQTLLNPRAPLPGVNDLKIDLTTVENLQGGVKLCQEKFFDVILLDLFLPDIQGMDAVVQTRKIAPDQGIIAYSQSEDENLVIQAFQHGADGYLRIKNLDEYMLYYELISVLERQVYRRKSESQRNIASQQREYQDLEALISSTTSVTARLFGADTLKDCFPELFAELKQNYGELLDLALEQRAFRVEYDLSARLRGLADRLGFMKASPRDVIEIHTNTLKEKNRNVNLAKSQAYVGEGRLMVLELMGYLTSFYRKYYVGLNNLNISSRLPPLPPKDKI